jgi:hypothetical protein
MMELQRGQIRATSLFVWLFGYSQHAPGAVQPPRRSNFDGCASAAGQCLQLGAGNYSRWLSEEPDPRDLMRPYPAEPMRRWPISTRVNKPENDDPSILEPV